MKNHLKPFCLFLFLKFGKARVDISNFAPFWNPHDILYNETYTDEPVSTTDDNDQDPTSETPGTLQEMKKMIFFYLN